MLVMSDIKGFNLVSDLVIFFILYTPAVVIFCLMMQSMKQNHNFVYLQERYELMLFGASFAVFAVAEFTKLIVMTNDTETWQRCFDKVVDDGSINEQEQRSMIQTCNQKVTWFPICYTMWGVFKLALFIGILIFKKGEDYIAKYSQNQSLAIVSIY